jgi:hypothetical protein
MVSRMSIEPHAVISVSTPAIRTARQDKPATLADYLANIARRFPECVTASGAANPAALAKRENRAMLRQKDRPQIEVSETARAMLSEARKAQGEETVRHVVATITGTMTTGDIIRASGMSRRQVEQALERALNAGLVVKGRLKNMSVWEPMDMPPREPEPKGVSPEAIKVTVRGVEYASLRARARHFGISVQAVHDVVRRGNPDGIGRRVEAAE